MFMVAELAIFWKQHNSVAKLAHIMTKYNRREHLKMLQKTFPYLFTDIYIARKQPQNSLKTSQKQPENSHKIAPKQSENSRETARKQPKNSPKIDAKQPNPPLKITIDAYFFLYHNYCDNYCVYCSTRSTSSVNLVDSKK